MSNLVQMFEELGRGKEMSEQELGILYKQIEDLCIKDFWFTFERHGVQEIAYKHFQKHKDEYFELPISGPNQIGKSFCALDIMMDAWTRRNKYRNWDITGRPLVFIWICPKNDFQVITIQKNLLTFCGEFLKSNWKKPPTLKSGSDAWNILEMKNGDILYFESFETNIENIEGYTADGIFMDEGHNKWKFFEAFSQRAVEKSSFILWMMKPNKKILPVYQNIFYPYLRGKTLSPFREVIVAGRKEYVSARAASLMRQGHIKSVAYEKGEAITQHFEATLSKEDVKRRIHGEWGSDEGQVYPFTEDDHVVQQFKIPKHWRRDISIDFAFSDNLKVRADIHKSLTVACFFAIPPPNEDVFLPNGTIVSYSDPNAPLYFQYNEYTADYKRHAKEHAKDIVKLFTEGELFESILIDYHVDETVFQEFQNVFFEYGQGYRFRRAWNAARHSQGKKQKQLIGHELVRAIIGDQRLFIMNHCKHWIHEVLNYSIDPDTQEPQEYGDHFCDEFRYYANGYPRYRDPKNLTDSRMTEDTVYNSPEALYLSTKGRIKLR